jgi:hypothetical protein
MSIRARLLTLAVGGVLPLLIVGLTVLWVVWSEKRNQLNESLEQQGELVAVVFDRWLDAQYQPLRTIAAYPSDQLKAPTTLKANLQAAMIPRRSWIDIRVLDSTGKVIAVEPAGAGNLPDSVGEKLVSEATRMIVSPQLIALDTQTTGGSGAPLNFETPLPPQRRTRTPTSKRAAPW